mgnify:FL=1
MYDIIGNHIQTIESAISLLTLLVGAAVWLCHSYSYKRVKLSCGTFKVRRKFFNTSDLTTIVSNLYYQGENVPGNIRKEIFNEVKVKGIKIS